VVDLPAGSLNIRLPCFNREVMTVNNPARIGGMGAKEESYSFLKNFITNSNRNVNIITP